MNIYSIQRETFRIKGDITDKIKMLKLFHLFSINKFRQIQIAVVTFKMVDSFSFVTFHKSLFRLLHS